MQERTDYMKPFVAGFIATLGQIITVFAVTALLGDRSNLSREITTALGFFANSAPTGPMATTWWMQFALLTSFNCLLLPYFYGYFYIDIIRGGPLRKGLVMGLGLWLFIQAIAMPLVGNGLFSLKMANPLLQVSLNAVYSITYGLILAFITESGGEEIIKLENAPPSPSDFSKTDTQEPERPTRKAV